MSSDPTAKPAPELEVPAATVHEAERASGPSGAILWGAEIDVVTAVSRRKAGLDVVIRGADVDVNRRLALQIESAVGPAKRGSPHKVTTGPLALPHFQQAAPLRTATPFTRRTRERRGSGHELLHPNSLRRAAGLLQRRRDERRRCRLG